jgi:hypothetical protein
MGTRQRRYISRAIEVTARGVGSLALVMQPPTAGNSYDLRNRAAEISCH